MDFKNQVDAWSGCLEPDHRQQFQRTVRSKGPMWGEEREHDPLAVAVARRPPPAARRRPNRAPSILSTDPPGPNAAQLVGARAGPRGRARKKTSATTPHSTAAADGAAAPAQRPRARSCRRLPHADPPKPTRDASSFGQTAAKRVSFDVDASLVAFFRVGRGRERGWRAGVSFLGRGGALFTLLPSAPSAFKIPSPPPSTAGATTHTHTPKASS